MPVRCSAPCTIASRRSSVCSGQITTSPSSRGPADGPASSTGNESTSVGPFLPRCSSFSEAIVSASTNAIATWPSSTCAEARAMPTSRSISASCGASGGAPRTPTSTKAARLIRRPQPRRERARVVVVGLDDALDQAVAHDVLAAEADELDAVDLLEDVRDDDQARLLVARQVDLRDVARDDHLRAEPQPRQEHLHLLGRGVLRLVEDHERVVEGASPHEGQWRDLDDVALEMRGDLLRVEHVVQGVEERAQVRV